MPTVDYDDLMLTAIASCSNHVKWVGSKFAGVKTVSNTHVGDIGQNFIESLCVALKLPHEFPLTGKNRSRQSPWDVKILGKTFEVKTATEDVTKCFQFNHIRHHRPYDGLICIGIAPDATLFDCFSKSDIATGKAGHLVTMDKGSSATWKLTKRRIGLSPIDQFEPRIRAIVTVL